MDGLRISVLGPLQVSTGQSIHQKFESNKVRALFTFLVVEMQRPHRREALADMFWWETSTQSALANLRYALADLRKVIGDKKARPPYLLVSRESLQFNVASHYELDIVEFRELIETNDIENLKHAVALYRGDFLEGFPYIGSDAFEEWLNLKREEFKQQTIEILKIITEHHGGRGEYQQALPYARQQIELEPWLEESHQQLMRLLALDGQRSAALAQYEACRQMLVSELNIEPTQETIHLYEAIRDGRMEKVSPLLKRELPAPGTPPFKGLQFFDEPDADIFFGRESLVSYLVDQIYLREKTKGQQFLAIIGASGSGKSSLVRAGLIPALRRGGIFRIAVITPTEHPGESLSFGLNKLGVSKGRALLFVDQFEELFTQCQNEIERNAFIRDLLHYSYEGSHTVVIALRADFYVACSPYEDLRKTLSQNQEYIGPMNADELRLAIEEPARTNGWLFEPGLIDLLLDDIGAAGERSPEPGALPLLSHALLETWYRRSGRMLTLAGYGESGRIHQAITKTAETVFGRLSPEEQVIARNIFLRLTELGEGTQETCRRVQLSELIPSSEADSPLSKTTETVLKMLSDARLVITTEETAEVAHEALIREWNRLHEWLTENRDELRLHRNITESALEWENQGRDEELVYRGTRLGQALEWADKHPTELNLLEQEFLETSKSIAEQEFAEREAQRQRELEAVRKLAESERQRAEDQNRSAQQLRLRAYYLAGILLLALVLAVTAFFQRNTATKQAHIATARELSFASINNLNVDAELSILLALQAVSESNLANIPIPAEVQDALHRAIQASRILYTLNDHASEVNAVAYSPDGKLLVTGSSDMTAKIRDAITGQELITLRGHTQILEDIAFSPDGRYLATASDDKTVKIWEVVSGQELRTLVGHTDVIWNVSFSPDGALLATGGDEMVKVWDVSTGRLLLTLNGQHAPIAFNPIGRQLATSSEDGTTILWDVDTEKELLSLPYAANILTFSPGGNRLATAMTEMKVWDVSTGEEQISVGGFTAPVMGIGFSPDGSKLATGGQDGTAIVWDAQTGTRLFALAGHAGAINDVAFNPQCVAPPEAPFDWCGVWLATAGRDGTARVWDVSPAGSRELTTLPGFSGNFLDDTHLSTLRLINSNDVEIQTWDCLSEENSKWLSSRIFTNTAPITAGGTSSNGKYLVTIDLDNTVKVWNTNTGQELSRFVAGNNGMVFYIAISSDGTRIATGGEFPGVSVWETLTGKELLKFNGPTGFVTGISISPDGANIAAGHNDGTVIVWDITTGDKLLTLADHTMSVYAIGFSGDNKRIVTAGMDQTARIWDGATGKYILTLSGHTASVLAVAFSPDGSRLVTGSHDGTARIWDISDGEIDDREQLILTGHDGYIDTVMFSPDEKLVATGSFQDDTVRVYMLDVMDVAALARSRLTRTFTLAECQKYLHLAVCP
jgi:WD40 repeat protein/DNA-binding SARP family transcriptional activator